MAWFEREGVQIAYEESGPPDGPVVVFSHGFLMDGEMFRPNVENLRDVFRCIVWDQRGFGTTGPTGQAFTYWDSARDLIGLLDHLEIATASLVGMSQGGFVSMRAALLERDRFRSLALIATRSDLDDASVTDSFEQLKAEWARNGGTNVADHLATFLLGPDYAAAAWTSKWLRMSREHFNRPVDALTSRDDITHQLREITHASIIFHGDADTAIDPRCGEALAARLPNCKGMVTVPGAGHTPNLTHAHDVNPPLRDFLLRYGR
ncbi:alpha/beta fold hydrolase [Paraburkholderia tagetis]|uniref:Alpha/beta hydrolase n=1 Tax=Paraburkholderia tagetis TaxID=2913261 RepID=A0A9X1ZY74_9BURK|nr:alpha/beta hydrolase [Paraburkholderia tagetis]MCG5078168.1 alpha/beta hydrolase [Paraburkholderia tagetis]